MHVGVVFIVAREKNAFKIAKICSRSWEIKASRKRTELVRSCCSMQEKEQKLRRRLLLSQQMGRGQGVDGKIETN